MTAATTTTPPPHVGAHWALFSKTPGVTADYRILASTFDSGEALRLVRAGLTGHPEDEGKGQPEQLPWLIFAGGTVDRPACSVMAVTWSQERDGTHQVIAPTRLLVVPWEEAAGVQLTYELLARGLYGLDWTAVTAGPPQDDGQSPIQVTLPSTVDTAAITATIERLGLDWTAQVAASLLDGDQVVLVSSAGFPKTPERLSILDAICSLLPYGYRAQLSVATWAGFRTAHTVKLTFAERARQGQRQAMLGGAAPEPNGDAARAYLGHLLRLHRVRQVPIRRLVEHLLAQRMPAGSRTPADAIARLVDVDLPSAAFEAIENGWDDALRLLERVLTGAGWAAFDERQMPVCIRYLADNAIAGEPDRTAAARHLLRLHWTGDVLAVLSEYAAGDLAHGRTERLRAWTAVLEPAQAQALLTSIAHTVAGMANAATTAAFSGLMWQPAANTAPWLAEIQEPFVRRPAVAAQLIGACLPTSPEPSDRLSTLLRQWSAVPAPPEGSWLQPLLQAVDAEAAGMTMSDLGALREAWPDGIVTVFVAALAHGRIDGLPQAAWDELIRYTISIAGQGTTTPQDEALQQLLQQAFGTRHSESTAARFDLLCLAGYERMPIARNAGYTPPDEYMRELKSQWGRATAAARGNLIARAPIAMADKASSASMNFLMRLADEIEPALLDRAAAEVRRFMLGPAPTWEGLSLTGDWPRRIGGWVYAIHQLQQSCDALQAADVVAWHCVCSVTAGANPAMVAGTMRNWLISGGPGRILDVLHYLSLYAPPHQAAAETVLWQTIDDIARGRLTQVRLVLDELHYRHHNDGYVHNVITQRMQAVARTQAKAEAGSWTWSNLFGRKNSPPAALSAQSTLEER